MNRRIILTIVVLMSLSVIGVVWLQMDLIGNLMRENEEQFENDVFDALNEVVQRLEKKEDEELFSQINGYHRFYARQQMLSSMNGQFDGQIELTIRDGNVGGFDNNIRRQFQDQLLTDPSLKAIYKRGVTDRSLAERIELQMVDELLNKSLANRGIDSRNNKYKFHYGVFSAIENSFVIVDGHYVVEDSAPREVLADFQGKNLYNPDYKVMLFPLEQPSPGELRIFFPNRSTIIWSSLWQNFVAVLLFTGVILFSFFYTLNVVFRQKKVSEMKTDFINNMTHEFKTPIATISLATDSITTPKISMDAEKVVRFANIIKQENRRMNAQVEKVLQMAQIDKDEFTLKLVDVNLHDVIQQAVENIGLQVEKRGGVATAEMKATKPIVEGDMTHISNVISNLLDNANKYSPENPEISVHTRNVTNGVEVIVKDKGMGMTAEDRKHIFDKFYRVHTGNLHDVKGFGLGLSYVKALMTAHKGQVDVKSELGKGSSFRLFFPFKVNV
ncbi:MAG: HAMP domain-containing histidine kinase [Saprospiraceae bacterium]|nr:HAMP domain-containing histidine kinase [Saprospiraceae bacterium]